MKKSHEVTLLVVLFLFIAAMVFAGNAHFVGLPNLNQTDDTVFASGKVAGLGNIPQINVTVSGDAACINPGNNHPNAANKESFSADGTFPVQNGKALFQLALAANFQPDCTPPMSVQWSNLSIVVSLDDGTVLLDLPTVMRQTLAAALVLACVGHGLALQTGCQDASPTAGGDKAILTVSPQALELSSLVGLPLPSQAVQITNAGRGALKWDIGPPSQPWLTVTPTSGINDTTVLLAFQTSALVAGEHAASFQVTAPGQPAAPVNVRLVLGVSAPVEICGDGQDNDGDGAIDENPPCVPPPDPTGCPAGAVTVAPGANIQTVLTAQPTGGTVCLQKGVHRITATLTPKEKQTLTGEAGAVLSGARLLTATLSGAHWMVPNQTQEGAFTTAPEMCKTGHPRCARPEDLFLDDVRLLHVATLAEVGPGKWFFDYPGDRIYLADNPTGKRLETSVTPLALDGSAVAVTLRRLTVEKFASAAQNGTIKGGESWTIEDCEVRWNHGIGIHLRNRRQLLRNHVHHNGQMGMGGSSVDALVEGNEIAHNNTAGYNPYWEAGGTKFTFSRNLIVRGNFAHHNDGPGLWTDIDNTDILYENNRVEDNSQTGIGHEIGYRAIIRNNTIKRNGFAAQRYWVDGAGITISSSSDVEVYGNTLEANWQNIMFVDAERGSGSQGAYDLRNLWVHDNIIDARYDWGAGTGRSGGDAIASEQAFCCQNNRFDRNTYYLGTRAAYFNWMHMDVTEQQWKGYGQDPNGTFIRP